MKEPDSHETYKVAASRLHWAALVLIGSLLAIVVGMYWVARPLMTSVANQPAPVESSAPQLQPDPARDLAALQHRERGKLEAYGWVDRQGGVARIPIERAMQLLAQSPPTADTRNPQLQKAAAAPTPAPSAAQSATVESPR